MTATSGVLIPGCKHCSLTARPRCRRGWLDFCFILNSGDSTSLHCSLWQRKKWSKNKTKNPATLTNRSSRGPPFHPHQCWSAPTFNFCGLLTFGGFLRSFSLRESRSTKLPSTTKPPGTKVSARLGSSLRERQGQALQGPEGRGRRGTEAEQTQLPSHRGGASSPPAPALLPLLPSRSCPAAPTPSVRRGTLGAPVFPGSRPSLRAPRAAPPRDPPPPGGRRSGASQPPGPPRQNKGMRGGGEERRPPCSPGPRTARGAPRAQPAARAGSPPRPPSPTGPREERGAPLEVAIGRWHYAAPCRSRAPGPRSKVDQGRTTGALEQYQLLGKRLQLFGVI